MPEVSQIQMERPNVAIQSTALWPEQRSLCVHQSDEASGLHTEEVGNQINSLPQQHVDNVNKQGGSQETFGNCGGAADIPRVYCQFEEECPFLDSGVGISRVHLEFSHNDDSTSVTQVALFEEVSKANDEPGDDHDTGVSPDIGNDGSCTPCDTPSTTPLQESGGREDKSTQGRALIRFQSEDQPRHEARSDLVVRQRQTSQWTPVTDYSLGFDHRVGRFHNWMGSQLPGKEHRRPMDTSGEGLSHQLSRTSSSFPGPEDIRSTGNINLDPTSAGQCNSSCLCEQDGGYSFAVSVQTNTTDLGLVHGKELNNSRRAPSRETECTSRLGVSTYDRFQRLATAPSHFPPTSGEIGSIHSGFVCFTNQCPTTNVLQLETGPSSPYSGRSLHFVEKPLPLHVPTFCSNLSMFEQTQRGRSNGSSDSTDMDKPSVVSSAFTEFDRSPNPSPKPQYPNEPTRHNPSNGNGGTSTSGCVACLRRSYRTEGLSDGVIDIIRKSWRTSTETAYSCAWRQWDSWCLEWSTDPLSAPVSLILEFLFEQFSMGKQYHKINTIRSFQ